MTQAFIQPLDVLVLRGNHLFGAAGSYGAAQMPPWPSVFAGALRSHLLAAGGHDPQAFGRGGIEHPELGTPERPGPFTLAGVQLARRGKEGRIERLFPLPADAVVLTDKDETRTVHGLQPRAPMLPSGWTLPLMPVLKAPQGKPDSGWLLDEAGWQLWLQGETVERAHLVKTSDLWRMESRPGVGLDANRRAAEDGKLFTVQAVAMRPEAGFVVQVQGCTGPLPPGMLRLGGDGRAARLLTDLPESELPPLPRVEPRALLDAGRLRILLTSPGLFADGWKLPGVDAEGRFSLHGVKGRLASAAVARAETVSGWDLARRAPKPARRVAPTGSVYWIDQLEATPEALDKLVETGLWLDADENPSRRAEGFNRIVLGAWR